MEIIKDLTKIKSVTPKILTLGIFDGVHLGHLSILQFLNKTAKKYKGESCLLTLEPNPKKIIEGKSNFKALTTLDEKIELLGKKKLEKLIILNFNRTIREQSAYDFIKEILVNKIKIHTLVVGYNHHFGKNREGNYELLEKMKKELGFNLIQLPEVMNNNLKISSTDIRNDILEGNIFEANLKLGYDFFLSGKVIKGKQLGVDIGFPTANLKINEDKIIPKIGSYVVEVEVEGKKYPGMLNIGKRPTVGGKKVQIEVNIFNFNKDIYGENIKVYFKDFLREEIKFEDIKKLQQQLKLDKIKTKSFF